jgi:hypothetical protein
LKQVMALCHTDDILRPDKLMILAVGVLLSYVGAWVG